MATSLTLGDTVTANNGGLLVGDQATIVGEGPIWKDDSDATYADIVTQMHGTGQPQFASSGSCAITGPASLPTTATVVARLRVAALEAGLPIPSVLISRLVGTIEVSGSLDGDCPTVPTWVELPITGEDLGVFFAETSTFSLSVSSGFKADASGDKHWRIYEARLLAILPGVAPPCRLFPADTIGSVGGSVRQYPPSKSRQRSSRGVGYY